MSISRIAGAAILLVLLTGCETRKDPLPEEPAPPADAEQAAGSTSAPADQTTEPRRDRRSRERLGSLVSLGKEVGYIQFSLNSELGILAVRLLAPNGASPLPIHQKKIALQMFIEKYRGGHPGGNQLNMFLHAQRLEEGPNVGKAHLFIGEDAALVGVVAFEASLGQLKIGERSFPGLSIGFPIDEQDEGD